MDGIDWAQMRRDADEFERDHPEEYRRRYEAERTHEFENPNPLNYVGELIEERREGGTS